MLVVTGTFDNERFIPDEPVSIPQKTKVIVTIVEEPLATDTKNTIKHEAFNSFMQYKGILPENFDYKKELSDYRDERHGPIA